MSALLNTSRSKSNGDLNNSSRSSSNSSEINPDTLLSQNVCLSYNLFIYKSDFK